MSGAEESYLRGREEGFDRGYEAAEEAAGARSSPAAASSPAPGLHAPSRPAPAPALTETQALKLGALGVLAWLAWRLLRTWPGRLVAVGALFAASGVISVGVVVLALIVGAVILAWAERTARQAVRDTRAAAADVRSIVRYLRARRT